MALNRETFQKRTITAIIFAVVMIAGLLYNNWSFFLLFSIVHFGAWLEYRKLVIRIDEGYKQVPGFIFFLIMLAGWCIILYFSGNELVLAGIHLSKAAFWSGLILAVALPFLLFFTDKNSFLKNSAHSLMGWIYISLSLGLLVALRNKWTGENEDLNLTIPLLIVFTLWINDTMAYVVGSFIGKTKMSSISPNKTWEGTIGGIVLAVIIMCSIAYFTGKLSIFHTLFISLIAAVAGTFGDLFESKLKRLAGVKDSGSFMPGHGGFLDRFDSLLFASTAVWLYASLFIH
jgi:phosphatidate cytidylyltransferase